ncbi:MAG: GyrI-like domain-containing protein [Candidatus Bathyarchaeota archaeon]|nr:GyrI-like domain-containing protein [Candidatus Bathyarchaeota archaeon]MDH5732585.1 GyrI-like domain-containing protein [Candidatus Bathyarchaeota archaeon]
MSRTNDNLVWDTLTKSSEDVAFILGSLANKKRLLLLTAVLTRSRTFRELQAVTKLGKTALAHHLGILVKSGLLKHTGKGQYELSPDGTEFLQALATAYARSRKRRELEAARRADYILRTHTKEKERKMKKFEVKIVNLEPMRVASVCATSTTPEHDAWEKMRSWAEPRGLLEDIDKHPVFGFNNPDPSSGRKEYGYEFWIRVGPETQPTGDVEIKKFQGGLYAVTTCKLKEEIESEFFKKEGYLESWKNIVDWVKSSKYKLGKHQCLEKAHEPGASEEELILDLYCPIEE